MEVNIKLSRFRVEMVCSLAPVAPMPASPSLPLAARFRKAHARLAPVVLAPLLITVISGMSYQDPQGLGRDEP